MKKQMSEGLKKFEKETRRRKYKTLQGKNKKRALEMKTKDRCPNKCKKRLF